MPKFKNVSPLGRVEIPAVRLEPIERGEEFEVPDEFAQLFAAQPSNYEPADDAAHAAVAALAAEAAADEDDDELSEGEGV